jgi:hypothetical protein
MKRTVVKSAGLTLLSAGLLTLAGGCNRPLLSPEETRTPFDSYDSVRGQYAPQKLIDELGREKPNLRQRLSAKD